MTEIENTERERDAAPSDLAAAQQRIADLERQVIDRTVDAKVWQSETTAAGKHLAAAEQLEAERDAAWAGVTQYKRAHTEVCEAWAKDSARLTAALRAIAPVYLAADEWRKLDRPYDSGQRVKLLTSLILALPAARAALPPELLAVIEAATK
jgi:hypothetical protein